MRKLDELSETTVFTDLLENEARQAQFPIDRNYERTFNPMLNNSLKDLLTPIDGLQSGHE
jgi:hypothetical protein